MLQEVCEHADGFATREGDERGGAGKGQGLSRQARNQQTYRNIVKLGDELGGTGLGQGRTKTLSKHLKEQWGGGGDVGGGVCELYEAKICLNDEKRKGGAGGVNIPPGKWGLVWKENAVRG